MGYSTHRGAQVIGVGVSAVSTIPAMLAQNTPDLDLYQNRVNVEGLAIARGVKRTADDLMRSDLIETVLCEGDLDFCSFGKKWKIDFAEMFADELFELNYMQEDGLVSLTDKSLIVTPLGRLFMRNIASVFDAYLEGHKQSANKVFSQSV